MRYLYIREDNPDDPDQTQAPPPSRPSPSPARYAVALRHELSLRNRRWALDHALPHEISTGSAPAVLYHQDEAANHGNFLPQSYARIMQRPDWARRLVKAHTTTRRALLSNDEISRRPRRSELDSCNSSDALLMNIFCHPKTLATNGVRLLLGIDPDADPVFGFKPRTPLKSGLRDCMEIDMKLGDLLIEAKLTEYDFQAAPFKLIDRYVGLEDVFDLAAFNPPDSAGPIEATLATSRIRIRHYQLIRGVMAAHASPANRFCVLCDARRPDLIAHWREVIMAVRSYELRSRLLLLTWQELAGTLPPKLQFFLAEKYGITPPLRDNRTHEP